MIFQSTQPMSSSKSIRKNTCDDEFEKGFNDIFYNGEINQNEYPKGNEDENTSLFFNSNNTDINIKSSPRNKGAGNSKIDGVEILMGEHLDLLNSQSPKGPIGEETIKDLNRKINEIEKRKMTEKKRKRKKPFKTSHSKTSRQYHTDSMSKTLMRIVCRGTKIIVDQKISEAFSLYKKKIKFPSGLTDSRCRKKKLIFRGLPQEFIAEGNFSLYKEYFQKSWKEVYKTDFSKLPKIKNKDLAYRKYEGNCEILNFFDSNPEIKKILEIDLIEKRTFKEFFEDYLKREEYVKRIEIIKSKKGEDFIKEFEENSKKFLEKCI